MRARKCTSAVWGALVSSGLCCVHSVCEAASHIKQHIVSLIVTSAYDLVDLNTSSTNKNVYTHWEEICAVQTDAC